MADTTESYVLGTGPDELERLGLQHRIWADVSVAAWKRAGIGPNSRVLDVGCGPGHATLDLAQLLVPNGSLVAVDESQEFVDYLRKQAELRGLNLLKVQVANAEKLLETLPVKGQFDVIYCRWVLCWLAYPESALQGMFDLLKPGGRLVIHDYFNWKSMCLAPRSEAVERVVLAAVESFKERQGNVDLCGVLPQLLRKAGFRVNHFDVTLRSARGGGVDSTVAWPISWWRVYAPKLVSLGKLSQADCDQAMKDLDELEKNPDWFFVCPPVFEFIAQKPHDH